MWYTSDILPDSNKPAPEFCNGRSLGSNLKASTPEEDENEEKSVDKKKSVDMDVDNEKSVNGDIETGQAQSITTTIRSANHADREEYSRMRDTNIANKKKLLSEMGLLNIGKELKIAANKKAKALATVR